jgi:hypothetical protein
MSSHAQFGVGLAEYRNQGVPEAIIDSLHDFTHALPVPVFPVVLYQYRVFLQCVVRIDEELETLTLTHDVGWPEVIPSEGEPDDSPEHLLLPLDAGAMLGSERYFLDRLDSQPLELLLAEPRLIGHVILLCSGCENSYYLTIIVVVLQLYDIDI